PITPNHIIYNTPHYSCIHYNTCTKLARNPATIFFFFHDPSTTDIYTLSLHDALPISRSFERFGCTRSIRSFVGNRARVAFRLQRDRKSTRLNSVTWPSRMPSSA